jgi:hypothetical protein
VFGAGRGDSGVVVLVDAEGSGWKGYRLAG